MTVLLDTGPLIAYLNQEDPLHEQSVRLLEDRVWRGAYGVPLGLDAVLDEGATLLRKRPGRREVSQRFVEHFFPPSGRAPAVRIVTTDEPTLHQAADMSLRFFEHKLSFTDCLLIAHAQQTGAVVATFDQRLAALIPSVDR